MYATFDRFEIEMTLKQALSCTHAGECLLDVQALLQDKKIKRQLSKISDDKLVAELRYYGAWDDEQLQDRNANEERIVWLAACALVENI